MSLALQLKNANSRITPTKLRDRGLVLSAEPFVSTHQYYPDGHVIGKPASVNGNNIPDYEWGWYSTDLVLNAPLVYFHREENDWVVTVHDYMPGPGAGDFVNRHDSADKAIQDILDYYFGDPSRINSKTDAKKRDITIE